MVEDKGDKMTTNQQSNVTAPTDDDNDSSGGGLRKQLEKALAENKDHKVKERVRAFQDAGFDTSTGLGKAISQVYDGDVTAEAILEFASSEYGHSPSNEPPAHPQAAQIALGQQQLDQVGNVAQSLQVKGSRAERLREAQQKGDMRTEGAIMAAQMQDMMDRQNQHL